jgi:hypothetical protein
MKNFILGAVVSVCGVVFFKKLYDAHGKFYEFTNSVKTDIGLADESTKNLGFIDKIKVVYKKLHR